MILTLGDASIGLGDMTHDRKGRLEENLLYAIGPKANAPSARQLLRAAVELVAEQNTQRRTDGPAHHQTQHASNRFSDPNHGGSDSAVQRTTARQRARSGPGELLNAHLRRHYPAFEPPQRTPRPA